MVSGLRGRNGVYAVHRVTMELRPGHETVSLDKLVKEIRRTRGHVICHNVVSRQVFFLQNNVTILSS